MPEGQIFCRIIINAKTRLSGGLKSTCRSVPLWRALSLRSQRGDRAPGRGTSIYLRPACEHTTVLVFQVSIRVMKNPARTQIGRHGDRVGNALGVADAFIVTEDKEFVFSDRPASGNSKLVLPEG